MKLLFNMIGLLLISLLISCNSKEDYGIEAAGKFCSIVNSKDKDTYKKLADLTKEYKEYSNDIEFKEAFIKNIECLHNIEIKIEPIKNGKINGQLDYYLKITPDKYKIQYEGGNFKIKFKIELINSYYSSFDWTGGEIEYLDASEYQLTKSDIYRNNGSEKLLKSSVGSTEWIEADFMSIENNYSYDNVIELAAKVYETLSKVKYFNVSLEAKSDQANNSESNTSNEEIVSSSDYPDNTTSSTSNFDELMESYENYVDQYISLLRKAKNNDLSALSEYPAMLQKAQDLQSKIENAKGDLSSAQLSKFIKLQEKIAKAALEM